ncbi:MAG: hypothetical protein BWY91_02898 [bacterium ADurb.BinA028]|nr:MAG: hypothetical protein BWY91_02898 [bacterium ADurb.BinA028]
MSRAPREARPKSRSRNWAGQDRALGQRMSLSPSFSAASRLPQAGQCVGISHGTASAGRNARTGATISGMTSPALRSTTVSPIRTSLRATSQPLCKVALETVEPLTTTGSITPNGVTRPVRPTPTSMARRTVLTSSGGYL